MVEGILCQPLPDLFGRRLFGSDGDSDENTAVGKKASAGTPGGADSDGVCACLCVRALITDHDMLSTNNLLSRVIGQTYLPMLVYIHLHMHIDSSPTNARTLFSKQRHGA